MMNVTPTRARLVRFLLASALLCTFIVGVGAVIFDRSNNNKVAQGEVSLPTDTTVAFDETIHEGCDGLADAVACPETELVDEDTRDGAVERYKQGRLNDSDAKYLTLTQEDYDTALSAYLGAAIAEPGGAIVLTPLWEASLEGLDSEGTFTWAQQWVLNGGAILFEQVFVLPDVNDVSTFTESHRKHMAGFGVEPLAGEATGAASGGPVLYRFQDEKASTPARRCVNRAIHTVERIVFVVTLASGGNCTTPSPELLFSLISSITERARLILS